jgi:hypothetical protein
MTINFRSVATDSMPERIKVTQELEMRYKKQQQEEAKRAQPKEIQKTAQGQQ